MSVEQQSQAGVGNIDKMRSFGMVAASTAKDLARNRRFIRFAANDPKGTLEIVKAIKNREPRSLSNDLEWIIRNSEPVNILGIENVPMNQVPVIFAGNHPDYYELMASVANINNVFDKLKGQHGLPVGVRWAMAENLVSTHANPIARMTREKIIFPLANEFIRRFQATYSSDFIPVPIDYDDPGKKNAERRKMYASTRKHLGDRSGSQSIGIFPEGDVRNKEELREFFNGVAALARPIGGQAVSVVPTGIFRDENHELNVRFGEPIMPTRKDSLDSVTERVRAEVSALSGLRISSKS